MRGRPKATLVLTETERDEDRVRRHQRSTCRQASSRGTRIDQRFLEPGATCSYLRDVLTRHQRPMKPRGSEARRSALVFRRLKQRRPLSPIHHVI